MNTQDAVSFLCKIINEVNMKAYGNKLKTGCICGIDNDTEHVDPEILAFIYNSVSEKIQSSTKKA